jgi:L-fuconolactonase
VTRLLDAHVHFWDPSRRHHDWLRQAPQLQRRFGPEDLVPGHHELVGAVFVQADARDDESLDEVRWVQQLAAEHQLVRGIVAYAPVQLGAGAADALDELVAEPLVVGVRRLLQGRPASEIVEPALIDGVRLLPTYGLTFDICVTHDQLPGVVELVRACPETSFVLDHLGKPPVASGALDHWRADTSALAELPNIAVKLSGLTTEAAPAWTDADILPYLRHGLDAFGPERCMIASDWPVASMRTTVEHWFDLVTELISDLTAGEQEAVLRGTAIATYGLASVPA